MIQRVMIIAGEASGDLHGSGVVRELRRRVPGVEVFGVGGDRMREAGMDLVVDISRIALMGFVEVVRHLRAILEVERTLLATLESRRPDIVVLIDYPGFNLRFAPKVHARGIPVLYYISPQVWAWNSRRVRRMRGVVDSMKVVFPFEIDIYRNAGIDVEWVGHPLVEHIGSRTTREELCARHGLDPSKRLLALLPGSRLQEIERMLPVMVRAGRVLRSTRPLEVCVGVAPNLGLGPLIPHLQDDPWIAAIGEGAYELMQHVDAAVVTSGTATLETGWFGTPMVVVYRTSWITYLIARMLVRVKTIGLVNIVAGSLVVPELIQHDLTVGRLVSVLARMLDDTEYARGIRSALSVIRTRLGEPGASARVVEGIIELGSAA